MKTLNLNLAGLYTAQNDFGPKGGMLDVANNVVIDQVNLGQCRNGFDALEFNFPNSSDRANRFGVYQDTLVSHFGDDSLGYYSVVDGWHPYAGTFDPPDPLLARCRFLQSNLNFYFTTSLGIYKLDSVFSTPAPAGVPEALDLEVSLSGSSGFFTSNEVKTISAKTTNASAILTYISDDDIVGILIGQIVTGTDIQANSLVTDISLSETVLITEGDLTAGNSSMTNVDSSAGLIAGQIIDMDGVPANTRVVSVSGVGPYTVVMSANAIETAANRPVTFRSDNTVTMSQTATGTATSSITFSDGAQIGYRLLWGIRDANEGVILGAPSALTLISNNTGGTRDTQSIATIPDGITTNHFYQLYRTAETPSLAVSPVDQEQLVVEGFPDNTDLSNGYITVVDQTPDSLKGQALYTGSDVDGIAQANFQPPLAKDFCFFKGYVLYANTEQRQQLKIQIDGVGGSEGVDVGDIITIDGVAFTGASVEDIAAGEFAIVTGGTPAQNIADTANSFIRVVNRYAANTTTYAYLLSGPNDLPGQMLLKVRAPGGAQFSVTASANGDAWTPNLPTTGDSVSSTSEVETNAIYIAKFNQPEAVPIANKKPVGVRSNRILRVVPLRDYVVIFTSDGVYRFLGDGLTSFEVQPFDLTVRLISPESASPLGNEAWCLSNQGVVSVSDAGVQSRSTLQIDDKIRQLLGQAIDSTSFYAFAVGYETDHRYILGVPDSEGDTFCTQEYCLNYFTDAWVRWTRQCSVGFIHPTEDRLYLGNGDNERVVFERKAGTFRDLVDEWNECEIVSSNEFTVVLTDVVGITPGDLLQQGDLQAVILEVDPSDNSLILDQVRAWTPGDALFLYAIACEIQWKPAAAGDPTEAKQCSEGQIIFRQAQFTLGSIDCLTDISPSFSSVSIEGAPAGGFGEVSFGSGPWGGVARSRTKRFYIPADKQYNGSITVRFRIREAQASWLLEGISLVFFDEGFELGN